MSINQQAYFFDLADFLSAQLTGQEVYTAWLSGETSDFIRLNHGKVRQPGTVHQYSLSLDLIMGQRHATASTVLSGEPGEDKARLKEMLQRLRDQLPCLPEDPHLLYSTERVDSESIDASKLPAASQNVSEVIDQGQGLDMVGIFAQGKIERGFANSLGQRNWFSRSNFNFDWSLYSHGDKGVNCSYGGLDGSSNALERKLNDAKNQLAILGKPARTVSPGNYRVYLTPSALNEILDLLSWSSFSSKATQTRQTPLLKLVDEVEQLSPQVSLMENTAEGVGPGFEPSGFMKKAQVSLIEAGKFKEALTSPRSAREYNQPTNGANSSESPESLHMAAGTLNTADVLKELGTGLYISNLWYLNYSDHASCRMTGMTRFATFWVENGEIAAPLNVMRFDESIYRALGSNLVGLTRERDFILDPHTYEQRSSSSARLPGAVVDAFCLTL
ncbi:MAG: metallopeptidase TldD-related protein [Myxococcota bacterium]|nr:metallopeptidase TldD-related protein [Myxococcota bacterium]